MPQVALLARDLAECREAANCGRYMLIELDILIWKSDLDAAEPDLLKQPAALSIPAPQLN